MKTVLTCIFALVSVLSAQTAPPATIQPVTTGVNIALLPTYMISAGGGYTRNASPNAAEGWIAASISLGNGYFNTTTIDMYSGNVNTVRTGFEKVIAQSGNLMLSLRADAGVSTVTPIIGSFSGGAIARYVFPASSKLAKVFISAEVRVTGASTTTTTTPNQVTPGFYLGVGKAF